MNSRVGTTNLAWANCGGSARSDDVVKKIQERRVMSCTNLVEIMRGIMLGTLAFDGR